MIMSPAINLKSPLLKNVEGELSKKDYYGHRSDLPDVSR